VTEDGMELKATRKDHEQNKEMLKKKRMQRPVYALELPNPWKKKRRERFLEPLDIKDGCRCRS
jgi:hypothetical protein